MKLSKQLGMHPTHRALVARADALAVRAEHQPKADKVDARRRPRRQDARLAPRPEDQPAHTDSSCPPAAQRSATQAPALVGNTSSLSVSMLTGQW